MTGANQVANSNETRLIAFAEQLQDSRVSVLLTMDELVSLLWEIRRHSQDGTWRHFCDQVVPLHPVRHLVHSDPFTRRAYEKPRGYAGDAELLDYIYGYTEVVASDLGRRIHQYTINSLACRAVRDRMTLLARRIDEVVDRVKQPRILSLACGHLREAQKSQAVRANAVQEYVAVDQDALSLGLVEKTFGRSNIRTLCASVGALMKNTESLDGTFDFVYAAGLYDYLPRVVATRLTAWMFDRLKPGASLLVANFLPDIPDVGYMESFMAWPLIYRTPAELADVAATIPKADVRDQHCWVESNENIVFLEIARR